MFNCVGVTRPDRVRNAVKRDKKVEIQSRLSTVATSEVICLPEQNVLRLTPYYRFTERGCRRGAQSSSRKRCIDNLKNILQEHKKTIQDGERKAKRRNLYLPRLPIWYKNDVMKNTNCSITPMLHGMEHTIKDPTKQGYQHANNLEVFMQHFSCHTTQQRNSMLPDTQ